jgi:hypothetical protein
LGRGIKGWLELRDWAEVSTEAAQERCVAEPVTWHCLGLVVPGLCPFC